MDNWHRSLCEIHTKRKFGDDFHKNPGTRSFSRIPGSSVVWHMLKYSLQGEGQVAEPHTTYYKKEAQCVAGFFGGVFNIACHCFLLFMVVMF